MALYNTKRHLLFVFLNGFKRIILKDNASEAKAKLTPVSRMEKVTRNKLLVNI